MSKTQVVYAYTSPEIDGVHQIQAWIRTQVGGRSAGTAATGTSFFGLLGLAPAYVVCFKNSEADSSLSTFCAPSLVVG
jgi:hypothetical protein